MIFGLFFGTIGESAAQDKAKERAGGVTGEFESRKDAKNGRS